MKLLVITAYYPPHHLGGYEMRCKDVVDGLIKRGHDVQILTTRCPKHNCGIHSGIDKIARVLHQKSETVSVMIQIIHDIRDLRFINRKVRDFQPDLVYLWHIQDLSNAIIPYFCDKEKQIIYDQGGAGLHHWSKILKRGIYFYKNVQDPIAKKFLKRFIYKAANLISLNLIKTDWSWPQNIRIYFNSYSALKNAQNLGISVDHARVIHSGVDILKFPYLVRDHINSPVRILVPGRIKSLKGTIDSIDLVSELMARKHNVKLTLVGEIQSEDYFKEILEKIEINGLKNIVEYLPMTTHDVLACLYQEADFCFFPSYFKTGFSRVPLEAMASGCVVITYGNEGTQEIVSHQETGFVIEDGDIQAAASLIEKLINNSCLYQNISKNARIKVECEYSLEKYIDSIEAYLVESSQRIMQAGIMDGSPQEGK